MGTNCNPKATFPGMTKIGMFLNFDIITAVGSVSR